ncbi:MAG: hypothetical protein AB1755_00530 [Candidatus Omnitrophota bacterium]
MNKIKKYLCWLGGGIATVLWYIFAEGWLILMVDLFGFFGSTIIVTLVTVILSWLIIYASKNSSKLDRLQNWLVGKEGDLSKKAQAAMKSGKILVVANTAIFLGPMVATFLMLMMGIKAKKVYIYSIFCALLCAIVWCGLYSGIFWEIHKIFHKPPIT